MKHAKEALIGLLEALQANGKISLLSVVSWIGGSVADRSMMMGRLPSCTLHQSDSDPLYVPFVHVYRRYDLARDRGSCSSGDFPLMRDVPDDLGVLMRVDRRRRELSKPASVAQRIRRVRTLGRRA